MKKEENKKIIIAKILEKNLLISKLMLNYLQ